MERIVIALVVAVAAALIALVAGRRRRSDAPTRGSYAVPAQLDRADFASTSPWLLAVFTSATCDSCESALRAVERWADADGIDVVEVEAARDRALHRRYGIEAVPTTLLVDGDGVVVRTWLGALDADDVAAAVAETTAGS